MSRERKLVAIDPGISHCGIAVFDLSSNELLRADWIQVQGRVSPGHKTLSLCREIVPYLLEAEAWDDSLSAAIELPEVYQTAGQKGRQSDIRDLAVVCGTLAYLFVDRGSKISFYEPKQWKGQVPEIVMNKRIMSKLSTLELGCIDIPKNKKNATDVKDAIGVGLYHLGRLRK